MALIHTLLLLLELRHAAPTSLHTHTQNREIYTSKSIRIIYFWEHILHWRALFLLPNCTTVQLITLTGQSSTSYQAVRQRSSQPQLIHSSLPSSALSGHLRSASPLHMPWRSEDKRPCQYSGTPACLIPHRSTAWVWWGTEAGRRAKAGQK